MHQTAPAPLAAVEYLLNKLKPLAPLDKDDYLTKFWDKKDWENTVKYWKEAKSKGGSGTKGEGINSSWMEDEYGDRVEVNRQTEIIAAARRTWLTLSNCGVTVSTFGTTDETIVSYFRRQLETDFIELRYCRNHWKADRLWKENFSSWGGPAPETKVSVFECDPITPFRTHFCADQTSIWAKAVSLCIRLQATCVDIS